MNEMIMVCHSEQYMHESSYISLFKYKSFDQSDPPESPQILDICSVVVL